MIMSLFLKFFRRRHRLNKRQLLKQLRTQTFVRLRPSKYGIGVFAIRDIPEGTDPFVACKDIKRFIGIKPEELKDLPQRVLKLVKDFCPFESGKFWFPDYGLMQIDVSYYLNHSKNPNTVASAKGEYFIASRDIKEDEELTVDYDTYDEISHDF